MYIATCGFDKSISIFDFFSGELITQVSGHSELVTGVKFSPDGRYLVSIGGDGCILMWRIADFLVKAMQDRLVELMSSAQRRNLKATAAVHKSHTEGTNSGSNAADLPPPLPTPSFGVPTPPTPPQQALKVPPPVSAVVAQDSKTAPPASVPKNRWAARVEQDHGYELFGKKVDPTVTPERNRNKFTLELSATAAAGLAVATGSGIKDQQHSESDNLGSTSNRLADELEAADDVILMVDSDEDEGDGSHLFKAPALSTTDPSSTAESYESDFEDPTNESAGVLSPGGTEPDLDQTQHAIEGMEKSAQDLENWLENMVSHRSVVELLCAELFIMIQLILCGIIFRSEETVSSTSQWPQQQPHPPTARPLMSRRSYLSPRFTSAAWSTRQPERCLCAPQSPALQVEMAIHSIDLCRLPSSSTCAAAEIHIWRE